MLRWLLPMALLLLAGDDAPPDDADDPPADEPDEDDEDEEIRDPKAMVKSLREANDRLAKKLDKKDDRIRELEGQGSSEDIRSARLESAFIRGVFDFRDSIDVEAAWDLASYKGYLDGVKFDDSGAVDMESMADALERLVDRYPYLIVDLDQDGSEPSSLPTTRQPKPRSDGKRTADQESLRKRFKALRDRRGRGRF